MLTKVYTASIQGIDAFPVTIETDGGAGAVFSIVGLPDTAVRESHQRMVSAINHSGVKFPRKGTTINLAPADIKKRVPHSTSRWPSACSPPIPLFRPTICKIT